MNKSLPLAVALALLVSACAHMYTTKPGDPRPTSVRANEGRLVVNQEPIYVGTKDATIVWYVPYFSPLRFPREGAVVFREAPEGEFRCSVAEDLRSVSCIDRYSKPGRYKYTIRLQQDGRDLEALDPSVVNN